MSPDEDRFLMTKKELEAEICGLLGGRTAEEVFFNDVSTGASNDIERATLIARSMVVEYGMSSLGPIQYEKPSGNVFLGRDYTNTTKNFSGDVANKIDAEVKKIVEDAHELARKIIIERKEDVELIAKTLLENETITEEQINYLLEHRELPKDLNELNKLANEEQKPSPIEDKKLEDTLVQEDKNKISEENKEASKTDEVAEKKDEN